MPFEEITYENLKKFGQSFLNRKAKVSSSLDKVYPEPQNNSFSVILMALVIWMGRQNKGQPHGSCEEIPPSPQLESI